MFVFSLLFLAILALSSAESDIPQYIKGERIISDNLLYDDTDGQSLAAEEVTIWPQSSPEEAELVTLEDQNSSITPESHLMNEQESSKVVEESTVWKIALVVSVLLVSIVGSLSLAYYLYVWRGGRIYYQPQKDCSV